MKSKLPRVHWRKVPGVVQGRCGQSLAPRSRSNPYPRLELTDDPGKVTCRRCWRTVR